MVEEDGTLRVQQIIAQADRELKSTQVEKDIPLELDPGNLTVVDINYLEESSMRVADEREEILSSIGRDSVQQLVSHMHGLERTTIDNQPFIIVPNSITPLPREKPIPKPKPLTRWEKFAREKGIKTKKGREHKVWDDVAQDFVPRYGKLRVQLEKEKNWVMEVPDNADPYEDQFAKAAEAKKERIAKNEFQRLRNLARARKTGLPGVGVLRTDTHDTHELKKAMHYSLSSTASLGKFQRSLAGEVPVKGFSYNAGKSVDKPFSGDVKAESSNAMKILGKINRPELGNDQDVIKGIEKKMLDEEIKERKALRESGRRSKRGGRLVKKSGAALASLTEGQMGDRTSRKRYLERKRQQDEEDNSKKKGGKSAKMPKTGNKRKDKSLFTVSKKPMRTASGRVKQVVKKRKR
ncbi:Ribosomal biogenesis regulatory protein [Trinorchestia longiramus]|nr:Ribosomal biogenesis regulatory protein [Trinorchestia longiramus]